MQLDQFGGQATGRLVKISVEEHGAHVEYSAFVPDPLPGSFDLAPTTWATVSNAAHQLGRLDELAQELVPNPLLIARPTIRQEAVSTSALEGTFAPAAEVLSSEVDEDLPRSEAVIEVINFIRATEHGLNRVKTLPLSTRLACELQQILVEGTSSDDWQAGQIRRTQVIIGPYKGCSVREATYIPPPPGEHLDTGMTAWERWIHDSPDVHAIVRVAAAHYQFEALHPFTDGNGRIGRLIALLQLMDSGLLSAPLIHLSPYFERNSDRYRHLLRTVSTDGAWDAWIDFFAHAIADQAALGVSRIKLLLSWRDTTKEMLRQNRARGIAVDVADRLIENPYVTVKRIAADHGVSVQAANNAVARLVELGILTETTGRNYNRIFRAQVPFDIMFR